MVDEFTIDNELLIYLVEQKPVLWNKTMEYYKNRVATQAAWRKIMMVLDPNFKTKDEKSKQAFTKLIIQKWTQIRDNYTRSYKKIKEQKTSGSGRKISKPYLYSKQLSFLQNFIQPKETVSNVTTDNIKTDSESEESSSESDETSETNSLHDNMTTISSKPERVLGIPKTHPLDAKMMKVTDSNNEPKTMNRHLSFFHGILPSLETFNEDEVLEFQMGVLQLLKHIKKKKSKL